jgi:hypothetical protein
MIEAASDDDVRDFMSLLNGKVKEDLSATVRLMCESPQTVATLVARNARMVSGVVNVGGYSRVPARAGDPNLNASRRTEAARAVGHGIYIRDVAGRPSTISFGAAATDATIEYEDADRMNDGIEAGLKAVPFALAAMQVQDDAIAAGVPLEDVDGVARILTSSRDLLDAGVVALMTGTSFTVPLPGPDAGAAEADAQHEDDEETEPGTDLMPPVDPGVEEMDNRALPTAAASARNGWQPGEMVGD